MHGVTVALDASHDLAASGASSLGPLLAHFDEPLAPTTPALRVVLSDREIAMTLAAPEWKPQFFFGVTQGFVGERGYALSDARSSSVVDVVAHTIKIDLVRTPNGAFAPTTSGLCHASLCLALREFSLFELHAAAVVRAGRAYVILGNSGAGKTSLALSLLADPVSRYLGDDRVLIRSEHGVPAFCAYPRTFHLALGTAAALPSLLALAQQVDGIGGKFALDPARAFAGRFATRWSEPAVILLPRVEPVERTVVTRAPAAVALGSLIESSALAWVDGIRHREANLALLGSIANRTPAFSVALGRDALADPAAVASALVAQIDALVETSR
jgi:hypothetical protein